MIFVHIHIQKTTFIFQLIMEEIWQFWALGLLLNFSLFCLKGLIVHMVVLFF